MRVLIVHNRYRVAGGEERSVELQRAALERAGIEHEVLERDSRGASRPRVATALLRGGDRPGEVAAAVERFGADVVHVHNMLPLFGPRALGAARAAGARVVLHLHNFRLFCSIATCFRDGAPCFRCRGRMTLPAVALDCRGSLPESAIYATALAAHQPAVLANVDRLATPSEYAAGQLATLGLARERLDVVPSYLPADELAAGSRADAGGYALFAGRLAPEKGVEVAVDAAARAGVPLKVAGDGALRVDPRAGVELLGRVGRAEVRRLLDGAAIALVPSLGNEVLPYAALEAMGRGVPVVAARGGSLPELVGGERCVPRGDAGALAAAMRRLWDDPALRRREGEALLARARERYGEERYVSDLVRLYTGTRSGA